MNRAELRALTASYLDDLDQTYFTPTQVNSWLNNAQRKVQRLLIETKQNFYLKCVQTTTVTNQCALALPDDFMMEHRLEIVLSGVFPNECKSPIEPITLMQQDLLGPTPSTPSAFYFKKNNIGLAPIPDNEYVIRLTYSYAVADMNSDTSVPDIPERYHELLSIYAAIDGFLKDDRDNSYLMKIADNYIEMMKREAQQRQEQASRRVVTRGDDWGMGDIW